MSRKKKMSDTNNINVNVHSLYPRIIKTGAIKCSFIQGADEISSLQPFSKNHSFTKNIF